MQNLNFIQISLLIQDKHVSFLFGGVILFARATSGGISIVADPNIHKWK